MWGGLSRIAETVGLLENRHPLIVKATRAGVAAAVAWLVVVPLGGPADKYAYYAPLGAVVAVSGTVAGSVRDSLRAVLAVLIGAALALAVEPLPDPRVIGLAVVVAVGTAIAGWHRLADMGNWVPIAAMFVLLVGSADLVEYLVGYLGLMTAGAVIGVIANVVFAPLPLGPSAQKLRAVRETLAGQLSDLADALRRDGPPTAEEWSHRQRAIIPLTRSMSDLISETSEARRANWRARHWRETASRQYELARALGQLAYLVDDLTVLLARGEVAGAEHIALGPRLRPGAADLLEAMARVLDSLDGDAPDEDALRGLDARMAAMVERIRQRRGETGDDLFTAGTLVIVVRRAMAALVPPDLAEEIPSRH